MPKRSFMILDGNAIVHRAWHALPPLMTKDGKLVNAVYGFLLLLFKAVRQRKPDYIAACFDTKAPTFRHKVYKDYKAGRAKQPQEFYDQFPIIEELLNAMNIPVVKKDGYEADDLIGTLVTKANGTRNLAMTIVTGDMDALQLIDDRTHVLTLKKGISDTIEYDPAMVKERYGLTPAQLIDYKALRGDPSDNIPGVKGIGEKGASELLQRFGTLEALFTALRKGATDGIKPAMLEKLLAGETAARESKHLVTIKRDVPLDHDVDHFQWLPFDREAVAKKLQALEFRTLMDKVPSPENNDHPDDDHTRDNLAPSLLSSSYSTNYILIDSNDALEKILPELEKQSMIAVDTETTSLSPVDAKLLGISIAWKPEHAYYISTPAITDQTLWKRFIAVLERHDIKKVAHNMKYDMEVFSGHDITLAPASIDTMIASYLLNSGSRTHNLTTLVFSRFAKELQPIEALIGKGKAQITMDKVDVARVCQYSCAQVDYTLRLAHLLEDELKKEKLLPLFDSIEMPLVPVLARMELAGVLLNIKHLKTLSTTLGKKLKRLENHIHELAGTPFNVASPVQLQKILFETLKLPTKGIGKTKTGISTSQEDLAKLKGEHKIIELIMEYRELSKLKSTYLDALPQLVNTTTGRLHTSFNQTVAATGRLSSSDPNLQNIPIRTELGNEVRKAFIAPEGMSLLSLDYSQFELRIIASLANDRAMIEAFEKGHDIHTATAANVHGIPMKEVTPDMRRQAKVINFGIIYGLGYVGLAQGANISRDEAKAFIEKYFKTYHGIKEYIDRTKALAASLGYVETMFGRRRYLPEIHAAAQQLRAQAERMAINLPVQGTQADIIKKAMIEIDKELPKTFPQARMLLQVHDELVFEVPDKEVKHLAIMTQDVMEHVVTLKVPIVVNAKAGESWGTMEDLKL